MQQNTRRQVLAGAIVAPFFVASCVGRTVPIPGDSDAVFADIESLIASTEAMVNFVVSLGIVGPETIAGAYALIAKARSRPAAPARSGQTHEHEDAEQRSQGSVGDREGDLIIPCGSIPTAAALRL